MNDNTANDSPEAEFNTSAYRSVGARDIGYFKSMALQSPRNRYRLCLHTDHNHLTQEMVICLKGFNYFPPHLHPGNRSESYHMIEGQMDVYLLDAAGGLIDIVKLGAPTANGVKGEPRDYMYRLSEPIYHLMIPRSEWTIYHEVLTGPWSKDSVVCYAPFAPSEDDVEEVEEYIREITGRATDILTK
jgi:cupin fold WbuC family metalloprotein